MDTRLNNGMCRCCASEGTFKDICSTYHWMGDEEIYSDMLKECFDINLNTLEAGDEGGICEVCITQLRNASNFKKQVLQTEQHFKKRLQDKLFKTSIVKVELPAPDEEVDSDNDNNISEDFSGPEYEVPIKLETQDEPKGKKRAAKATTSRAKKAKLDDGEPSTKRPATRGKMGKRGRHRGEEITKHLHNLKCVLQHSNATPLKPVRRVYGCVFCKIVEDDPCTLKKHVLEEHAEIKATYNCKKSLSHFFAKLDITDLQCNICCQSIENLESLIVHLETHSVPVYRDVKNHMLQFKFNKEESSPIKCVLCNHCYDSFKTMIIHMNGHYRNWLCNECDSGFVNLKSLSAHKQRHKDINAQLADSESE